MRATSPEMKFNHMLRLTHEDKRKGLKAEYFGVRVKQGGLGGSSEKQLLSWEGKWKPDCD